MTSFINDSKVFTVAGLSKEGVFVLNGLHVDLGGHGRLGGDVIGQGDIEVADGRLRGLLPSRFGFSHEGNAAQGLGVRVFDLDVEGQAVFPEGVEAETQL